MIQLGEAIKLAVAEVVDVEIDPTDNDQALSDLGIDSIALLEVGMLLEQRYGVELDLEEFRLIDNVGGTVAAFKALLVAAGVHLE